MRWIAILVGTAGSFAQDLAVVEKVAGSVGFYSAAGSRTSGVRVGAYPHEIALSPDRKWLYVTDNGVLWMTNPGEGGNTISILDRALRRKAGVIDLGAYRRPHGIAVDPKTGRLLVTIENPDGLLLVDPAARKVVRKYDVQGKSPHMVLLGPGSEWAYVSNAGSSSIAAVHLASARVKLIPTGARPQGGVLSPDGRTAYITNADGNSITIIDTAKNEGVGVIQTGKGPGRIALTPDRRTLVYNLQPGQAVGFADVASRKETGQVALGGAPLSLSISADGRRAWAGVQEQDRIVEVSVAERKILRVIPAPKDSGPDPALPLE